MNEENKNVICPLPWHHIAIRPNGRVYPCCYFRHVDTPAEFNLSQYNVFNHPFLISIRGQMKKGVEVKGCKQCYHNEKFSGKSMRLDMLRAIEDKNGKPFEIPSTPDLKYLDLALSNVCNNRCRMCGPDLSTNWYADAKALGIPIKKGVIENEDPLRNIDVSNLTYLKLIGGEPMLEQDKFVKVLEKCNLPQLNVFIATNVTTRPNSKLMELLEKCNHVKVACSIDAYGKLNNFLRKGSEWEEVDKNLNWYSQNFKTVIVHSVISIYNINKISELNDYIENTYPNIKVEFVMIDGSDWMQPFNLPVDVKDKIMKQLNVIENENIVNFRSIIYDSISKTGNFNKFVEIDSKLNNLRNEHWKDANPELYEMLKEYYE
jgi:MoaA/NifB/PqqE/SkfB family radical SAM enzyme